MMMTQEIPLIERAKRILCLHCEHLSSLDEFSVDDNESRLVVKCSPREGELCFTPLRSKCKEYKADCQSQPEPCNGDCEKCQTRTEWQEWDA